MSKSNIVSKDGGLYEKKTDRKIISPVEFEGACSPYTLRMNYKKNHIVLDYNDSIITDGRCNKSDLKYIASQIKWCVEKSFHVFGVKFSSI